jgi:hypothetical protein
MPCPPYPRKPRIYDLPCSAFAAAPGPQPDEDGQRAQWPNFRERNPPSANVRAGHRGGVVSAFSIGQPYLRRWRKPT